MCQNIRTTDITFPWLTWVLYFIVASSFADWQCTITADETIRGSRGYHLADRGPYRLVLTIVMRYHI